MTINDFIECFNKTLQNERTLRGLENQGHFVFYQWSNKKIGNYHEYKMKIEYVHTIGIMNPFVTLVKTVQLPSDATAKEKLMEDMHQTILTSFLTQVLKPDIYEALVKNTYGT